ncbi:MAG: single-stranded-DNA-specific exonuclease RecJ [Chloroflexota bacterium]
MSQDTVPVEALRGERAVWNLASPLPDEIRAEIDGRSVMLSHLLYCRGYRTVREIAEFFAQIPISHDPFLLPDMGAAVDRIGRALADGERIAVYGDFDCDGITSAALLDTTLRRLGADPLVEIPDRGDGHGLHLDRLTRLADRGVNLIITADCAVTALAEVQVAQDLGMDVVVTDHHEARPDLSLPDCLTVAPTRYDSTYPYRHLCGVGVVYKLAQALHEKLGGPDPSDQLDLVALGTIADVVPVRDENRSLVIAGLQALRQSARPGLLALLDVARVEQDKIDPVSVGFYLAPRINAANRMASPALAYELLTADDPSRAGELASRLSSLNGERQKMVSERFAALAGTLGPVEEVLAKVASGAMAPVLIVTGDWAPGISGLLSAKLVDRYGLPAFAGCVDAEGVVTVSGRGAPGVRIDSLLETCEASLAGGLFLGFGGHAGAGGFRVAADRLEIAEGLLKDAALAAVPIDCLEKTLKVDAEVSLSQLDMRAAELVRSLAPFGMGFDEPVFMARGVTIRRRRVSQNGKHIGLTVRQGNCRVNGVFFNASPSFQQVPDGARLDVAFHLQIDNWRGASRPQVQLRDWRLADGPHA